MTQRARSVTVVTPSCMHETRYELQIGVAGWEGEGGRRWCSGGGNIGDAGAELVAEREQ